MQGGASWRDLLVAKLARNLQNDEISNFKMLQCEIRKFVWALTLGERYFKILSVEWFKSADGRGRGRGRGRGAWQ